MLLFFVLLIGVTSAANVICTDYGKDIGGGGAFDGYYVRPVPKNCRFQHRGNWSPQFRIKEGQPKCKGGWKKYKKKCYFERGDMNWQDGERFCNGHQAHIWQPNDREEYQWVEQNVMAHNTWYWLGTVCNSKGDGTNPADFYTASGEDMRKIQQKMNVKMHPGHNINNHSLPVMMSHRNNNTWRWMYHQQFGKEGRRIVCEAPMG